MLEAFITTIITSASCIGAGVAILKYSKTAMKHVGTGLANSIHIKDLSPSSDLAKVVHATEDVTKTLVGIQESLARIEDGLHDDEEFRKHHYRQLVWNRQLPLKDRIEAGHIYLDKYHGNGATEALLKELIKMSVRK